MSGKFKYLNFLLFSSYLRNADHGNEIKLPVKKYQVLHYTEKANLFLEYIYYHHYYVHLLLV